MFESRKQKLKEEVTYYAVLSGKFKDEEAMYEVDIQTDLTWKNKNLTNMIVKTHQMCVLAQLQ